MLGTTCARCSKRHHGPEDVDCVLTAHHRCIRLGSNLVRLSVGQAFHNNNHDSMSFQDRQRGEQIETRSMVAEVALRCLEMLDAYQMAFEPTKTLTSTTLSTSVQWQLQLDFAFHCLREARSGEAEQVYEAALNNVKLLKGPDTESRVRTQIKRALAVIGGEHTTRLR